MADVILIPGSQYEAVSALQHEVVPLTLAVSLLSNVGVIFRSTVVRHAWVLAIAKQPNRLQKFREAT